MSEDHRCLPRRILFVTLLSCLAAFAQAQSSKIEKPPAGAVRPGAVLEVPLPDPAPIPAMTPEELPARVPLVTYRHGQLTIDSINSTLSSILNAIQTQTGATISIPDDCSERVAVHLSGPPNIVILQLIDGSMFGYVIRSSPEDPEGLAELVLNRKPGPTAQTLAASSRSDIRLFPQSTPRQPVLADIEGQRPTTQPPSSNPQAIAEMETDKGLDKAAPSTEKGDDQPAAVAQAGSAVNMDDPHPPPPPQLTALQQTPDQNQQQQVTNRQFLQDLYSARQKLQSPQPQSPQPQ